MTALQPPFRAQDMSGLMKRVVKGVYPPIPAKYSKDLDRVIAMCLRVTPSQRPSIDDLLASSQVMGHLSLEMGMVEEDEEEKEQGAMGLLGTIKVPRNLGLIGLRLPKPKYEERSRTGSEPPPTGLPNIPRPPAVSRGSLNSAREHTRQLAPIKELKEPRSANPEHDKTRKFLKQKQP